MRESVSSFLSVMYESNLVPLNDRSVAIDPITRISPGQGRVLEQIARLPNVKRSLEIGFAYGFSTLYILEGLFGKADASHVSIDPFEKTQWDSVGLEVVKHFGYMNFSWVEDFSIHQLSRCIKNKCFFDMIYIDGNHRFDDILVDFYMADQVLNCGGYLLLDDMWLPSTQLVARFIVKNRAYEIVPQAVENVIVFRKLSHDSRRWDHFVEFY